MAKHPLQFLEIPRRDPEKEPAEVRIKHFGEIYDSYDGANAAAQACSEPGSRGHAPVDDWHERVEPPPRESLQHNVGDQHREQRDADRCSP